MAGRAKKFFKRIFGRPKAPKAPTAADLYSGPQAFGDYRAEGARATGDPSAMGAARQSLGQLQQIGQTGWTDTDRQQLASNLRQGQQASAATRQAAVQQAQARGMGSGGLGFLAGLTGSAADANAAANAAASIGSQGAANRMAATQAAGGLGMGIDAQQFGQQAQTGAAQDAFNQWAGGMQSNATQQAFANQMDIYKQKQQQRQARMAMFAGLAGSAIGRPGGGG
jgi:hypothetical protein